MEGSVLRTMTKPVSHKKDEYSQLVVEFPLRPIHSRGQYKLAAAMLDKLAMRDDAELRPDEADYLETLSLLIEAYDREHYPIAARKFSPLEMLQFLMEQNSMSTTALGELVGSKGLVSEILHGKRELSKTHIRRLSEHFKVSPALFF
jgi:HTH-type transcriptional regulator/antitoxin HigA